MSAAIATAFLALLLAQAPTVDEALRQAEQRARAGETAEARRDVNDVLGRTAPGDPGRARLLGALALLDNQLGDHEAAVRHAREAANLYEAAGDLRRAANARNTAGLARLSAGQYREAAAEFDTAAAGSARAGDAAGQSEQLSNLGNAFFFQGRYDEASRAYQRALALVDHRAGEPWSARRRRIVRANQAALAQRLGQYADALAIYREMAGPGTDVQPVELAQILVNQGALYRRLGDPYKALETYDAARTIFAEHAHADGQLAVLTNRGIVLALDLDDPAAALDAFSQALDLATRIDNPREQLLARLYRGEAALRAGHVEDALADFRTGRDAGEALGTAEERWKAWYGLGRAEAASGDLAAARQSLDRALTIVDGLRETLTLPSSRADFFQDKREVFDARIRLALSTEPVAEVFALIERSRARAWRDRLGLDGPVDLASVQRALPDDAILMSFWHAPSGAAVVRVTSSGADVHPIDVDAARLDGLLGLLRRPEAGDWTPAAAALVSLLGPPGLLREARQLIVVPDGALGLLPVEVLPLDDGPLVAQMSVRYVPTAAALLRSGEAAGAWRSPWTTTVAAFGDPRPGQGESAADPSLPALPASADEVREVAATLGGQHALFVGPQNLKTHLADALAREPVVLHLATHGIANPAAAERSHLLFSPSPEGGPAQALFLREIYDLPLDAVELAVLSACDTERGPVVRGEGVQGFSRALLAAGAKSAVTTLWRVPDRTTASLMHVFYDRLQRGDDRAEALAVAKRTALANPSTAHPHYWAAFVLSGDGGPVPRAPRLTTLAGWALVLAGVGLAALRLRRGRHAR